MLVVDRQPIKQAILNLISQCEFVRPINGFLTWAQPPSRRLKLWPNVDPGVQPAAYLLQHRESYTTGGVGRLVRRYLDMGIWCYARTDDESIVGDDLLDVMEMALETVLQPDDTTQNELTLGGLCYWCRITREDGLFIRDPGDIDSQALLVLPVRVLIP